MKTLLAAAALSLLAVSLHAQDQPSVWKHLGRPDYALGLHFYSLSENENTAQQDLESRYNTVHLGAMAGLNLPFVPITDHLSAGLNPNIGVAFGLSGSMGPDGFDSRTISFEFPMYATIKYGTDATWAGSKTVIGASAGVGYHYTVFIIPSTVVTYGLPSVMAELNFGKRRSAMGLIKLRYSASLGSHSEDFGDDGQIVFTHHSFYVMFTPGY